MIVVLSRAAEEAAPRLSDALLRYPGTLLQTDREGWIQRQTHGVRLWAVTERVP